MMMVLVLMSAMLLVRLIDVKMSGPICARYGDEDHEVDDDKGGVAHRRRFLVLRVIVANEVCHCRGMTFVVASCCSLKDCISEGMRVGG